jgi:hypothetical protein
MSPADRDANIAAPDVLRGRPGLRPASASLIASPALAGVCQRSADRGDRLVVIFVQPLAFLLLRAEIGDAHCKIRLLSLLKSLLESTYRRRGQDTFSHALQIENRSLN